MASEECNRHCGSEKGRHSQKRPDQILGTRRILLSLCTCTSRASCLIADASPDAPMTLHDRNQDEVAAPNHLHLRILASHPPIPISYSSHTSARITMDLEVAADPQKAARII